MSSQQVLTGLNLGYRLLDTASHYDNEADVAEGIAQSGIPRSDLQIITKVWMDDMGEGTMEAIRQSLKRLRTDYVDLLLVHFPGTNEIMQSPQANRRKRELTWKAMEEAQAAGMAKAIGVANYCRRHLKELFTYCSSPPAYNQLEIHPYFPQQDLVDYCREKSVPVMAFSPLAHGELRLLLDDDIVKVAKAHNRTPAQVVLKWLLQQGFPPVVFSSSAERMKENLLEGQDGDFELTEREMSRLSFMERDHGRVGFDPNIIA